MFAAMSLLSSMTRMRMVTLSMGSYRLIAILSAKFLNGIAMPDGDSTAAQQVRNGCVRQAALQDNAPESGPNKKAQGGVIGGTHLAWA